MNSLSLNANSLSEVATEFEKNGYLILRNFASHEIVSRIREVALRDVAELREPIEYEADVKYPGAPESRQAKGGRTVRRLRQALSRDPVYQQWICHEPLVRLLGKLLGTPVSCPLAHHNCVMTKHPEFSSDTGWHRDLRFWRYEQPELVSVWLALGDETLENGCLQVLPGTHRMQFTEDQLNDKLFLDPEAEKNQSLLKESVTAELSAGDILLFHAQTFHAATRNYSEQTKYSVVFTFHGPENRPVPKSRSAEYPELILPIVD